MARTATGLADRSGIGLELELDDEVDAEPETRSELLRILGEAISNATRHGKASKIHIRLSAEPTLRLAISDDGSGFEAGVGAPSSNGGFGLTSMRERAEGLGGELHVRSRAGQGTVVEVVLPEPRPACPDRGPAADDEDLGPAASRAGRVRGLRGGRTTPRRPWRRRFGNVPTSV